MSVRILAVMISMAFLVSGCESWSTASVERPAGSAAATTAPTTSPAISPEEIIVTEEDITDRQYKVLGDIEVTVNKTTIFSPNPTRELVNEQLRQEAKPLGADAVILVRYGSVGVSFMSWGTLEGRGRAVRFTN